MRINEHTGREVFPFLLLTYLRRQKERENQKGEPMTSTDICNMALSMIGQGRIHDLDEESEQARQCKVYYDHIRKTLLSNFTWGFAHRFKRLVKVEGTFPKWEYAYAYPENCLAVHMVYDQSEDQIKDDIYTEYDTASIDDGRKIILCDFPHAVCDYTANVTNADMFPTVFVTALAQFIAASLAIPLSGSSTLANYYQQSGNLTLEEAKVQSARQRHHTPGRPCAYFDARF